MVLQTALKIRDVVLVQFAEGIGGKLDTFVVVALMPFTSFAILYRRS